MIDSSWLSNITLNFMFSSIFSNIVQIILESQLPIISYKAKPKIVEPIIE